MNAEFQWWLLILGIVIGGALVYLVLADLQSDVPVDEDETAGADEPATWPGPGPIPPGAPSAVTIAAPDAPVEVRPGSTGDHADVEGDRAESEAPVADLGEPRPHHRRRQSGRVREPLE